MTRISHLSRLADTFAGKGMGVHWLTGAMSVYVTDKQFDEIERLIIQNIERNKNNKKG